MLRPSSHTAGVIAAMAVAAPLFAQWQPVEVAQTPPPRTGFLLLPILGGELLLFGGDVANPSATEWVFDGVRWRSVLLGIPRRSDAAGAVSGTRRLIHGGQNGAQLLNDTWISGPTGQWLPYASALQPGLLTNVSMAGDPASERVVMIGQNGSGVYETWFAAVGSGSGSGSGSGWTAGPVFTAPQAALVEDTVRGEVQLFVAGLPGFEMRRLIGNQWVTAATALAGPALGEVAFEPNRGRAVVLEPFTNRASDEWDGLRFVVDQLPSGAFVPTARTAMAFHPGRDELVLVSNYNNAIETWRYVVAPLPAAFAFGSVCGAQIGLQAGDSPQLGSSHRLRITTTSPNNFLTVSVLGLSTAQNAGLPLPLPLPQAPANCELQVEALVVDLLGVGAPQVRLVTLPSTASLLGLRYAAQALQLDGNGFQTASNGLQVQIGAPLPENLLLESFASAQNRDRSTSGDTWANGNATPAAIGGDGRHGSFDPAFGQDLGNGVFVWNTDNALIPASATLDGLPALVSDGRFFFTDFVVPAGVTVRFTGSAPAIVTVRGQVQIDGVVSCDAEQLPFFVPTVGAAIGQRVSTFQARRSTLSAPAAGQPGGLGGPGGGRGGNGGEKCLGAGPIIVNGVTITDGQPGDDVRLPAGHAYAAAAAGTGGQGSTMMPALGTFASAFAPLIINIYRAQYSVGGSGGGYLQRGGLPTTPTIAGSSVQPLASPAPAASLAFPLLPFPPQPPVGYSSLNHYLVGGSGGGGGGCHVFGTIGAIATDVFVAGSAGSGGGGALALRAGGDLTVLGELSARGGAGVLINGDNPNTPTVQESSYGVSSPGGGGSGGSLLLQSAARVRVLAGAALITSGGLGSRTGSVTPTLINAVQQAGAGSPGFYRLESELGNTWQGTGVPAFSGDANGALFDRDARTGSRSTWLLPTSQALPVYLRYELLVDIGGNTVLFSDDPNVSTLLASDPNGPVRLRFQGGRLDPLTGQVPASTVGPWRTTLRSGAQSLNRDLATALRFDLVVDKGLGVTAVRELRIVWR
ncbi:MAG: hypothetical protein MUC36_20305 [Planctomycetes bacterium]|nr:hypothetical protein [Planctomycetota bacterium]